MDNHLKSQFLINPALTFLNFGSFGACPIPVFNKYQEIQKELEFQPIDFIVKDGPTRLESARAILARYVGCHKEDLVFVTNPSYGINTIAKSLKLSLGDEVLSTNLEYGAMDRVWSYYCQKKGAKYVQHKIDLPITSKEEFCNQFWKGYTKKTKVIFISHITSATGLILPVNEICSEAKRRGLLVVVDGAHAPGQINLNVADLKADIYVGACHKWMMAPKGASFLYVNKSNQEWIDPLLISWGYKADKPSDSLFIDYHQMTGTRDFSAFLAVPAAIEFMKINNWDKVKLSCAQITRKNAPLFCDLLGVDSLAPISEDFIGQMFSIPINNVKHPDAFHDLLLEKYNIEIPVYQDKGKTYLRYSINGFNNQGDLDYLYEVLKKNIGLLKS